MWNIQRGESFEGHMPINSNDKKGGQKPPSLVLQGPLQVLPAWGLINLPASN